MEDSPCKRDRMLEDRRDVACIREKKSSLILVALASYFFFCSLHSRLVSLSVSINLRDVCGPSQVHGNHGKMISSLELTFPIYVVS